MTAMQYVNKVVYTIPDVKDNTNKLVTQKNSEQTNVYVYTGFGNTTYDNCSLTQFSFAQKNDFPLGSCFNHGHT